MLARPAEAEVQARRVLAQTVAPTVRIGALDALQSAELYQGKEHETTRTITEALELAEQSGETALLPGLHLSEAIVLMRLGHDAQAESRMESLLPHFRSQPLHAEGVKLLAALGGSYAALGCHPEARALLHEALRAARELGSAGLQVVAANNLLFSHHGEGTAEAALSYAEEALSSDATLSPIRCAAI